MNRGVVGEENVETVGLATGRGRSVAAAAAAAGDNTSPGDRGRPNEPAAAVTAELELFKAQFCSV